MNCQNFFCNYYNKKFRANCYMCEYYPRNKIQHECEQRKAFDRFKNRLREYESKIPLMKQFELIKKELS